MIRITLLCIIFAAAHSHVLIGPSKPADCGDACQQMHDMSSWSEYFTAILDRIHYLPDQWRLGHGRAAYHVAYDYDYSQRSKDESEESIESDGSEEPYLESPRVTIVEILETRPAIAGSHTRTN